MAIRASENIGTRGDIWAWPSCLAVSDDPLQVGDCGGLLDMAAVDISNAPWMIQLCHPALVERVPLAPRSGRATESTGWCTTRRRTVPRSSQRAPG